MNEPAANEATKRWFAEQLERFGAALRFNPADVLDDLASLEAAFPSPESYKVALEEAIHQLHVVVRQQPGKGMRGRLNVWRRHAFQSMPARGGKADLRIVYKASDGSEVELLGFGHRHVPRDIYQRLRSRHSPS
ncbi:MAG: hypothetical protein M0Z66_16500 [Thermaerobacter sp.]|nr:hypothetical protein [Thermaerobacter sp.]